MHKIFIRYGDQTYRFINFEFRDHADGTFLVVFDRKPRYPEHFFFDKETGVFKSVLDAERTKFRISYHTSGLLNFHGLPGGIRRIYCDPTFQIIQPQFLGCISIPAIESLDIADEVNKDWLIELPAVLKGRQTFNIALAPDQWSFDDPPLALINFKDWFNLVITFAPMPVGVPIGMEKHVFKHVPTQGRYQIQLFSQEQALISFHQKRNKSSGLVTYWEPNESIYRIIFAVPARVPPKALIEFLNPETEAVVILVKTNEIKFKAKGKGGFLKTPQPIKKIVLDAEL